MQLSRIGTSDGLWSSESKDSVCHYRLGMLENLEQLWTEFWESRFFTSCLKWEIPHCLSPQTTDTGHDGWWLFGEWCRVPDRRWYIRNQQAPKGSHREKFVMAHTCERAASRSNADGCPGERFGRGSALWAASSAESLRNRCCCKEWAQPNKSPNFWSNSDLWGSWLARRARRRSSGEALFRWADPMRWTNLAERKERDWLTNSSVPHGVR